MTLNRRILLLVLSLGLWSCQIKPKEERSQLKEVQTIESGDHIYIVQPFRDYLAGLSGGLRETGELEIIKESINLVREWGKRNANQLPPHLRILEGQEFKDSDSVARSLVSLRKQMTDAMAEAADIGIQMTDFIPSGILLYGGGSLSSKAIGGSSVFGVVIVPLKIIRLSKTKFDETSKTSRLESLGFSVSIVNITAGDVGVSDPTAKIQAGVGIIFKPLNRATDFTGFTLGASLNLKFPRLDRLDSILKTRLGSNVQMLCVTGGDQYCKNYAIFGGFELGKFTSGPRPKGFDFSLTGKAGAIIPMSPELAKSMTGGTIEQNIP
jgi:hypothetical protein